MEIKSNDTLTSALKNDSEKPRVDLIEPAYIIGTADVLTYGMKKYGKGNWQQGFDDIGRVYAAAMRHMLAFWSGEYLDSETGKSHLYHASCNLMMLDWYWRKEQEDGNRKE